MSDHTIIDTSNMTGKNKLTFKSLSANQKAGIIGGGVAMTAALASAVYYLIGDTPNIQGVNEEANLESIEPTIMVEDEVTVAEDVIESPIELDEKTYDFTIDTEVQFSDSVHDGMSFEDAFSAARLDVGTGGWFNWHSQSFSTFTKEEWDAMSTEEQGSFISEVIENSSINTGEWVETSVLDDNDEFAELSIESDESILETVQSIAEEDNLSETITQEEPMSIDNEQEDLSEDIIIVKPVRGADLNEDGIVDAIVFDNDGDGNIDLVALDEDHDGTFESFMINEDGDEDLDVFIIDEGGDGIDGSDSTEEISDVVNMEDFVVLSQEEVPEDLSFIDDIFGDEDDGLDDDADLDLGLDEAGL